MWTARYVDSSVHGLSIHAVAVDDAGRTLVLAHAASRDPNIVYAFDAGGAFLWQRVLNSGYIDETTIRANSQGAVVVGTNSSGPRALVHRLDPNGGVMFTYSPAGTSTALGGADICGDGTVVAVVSASSVASLIDLDTAGNVVWSAPVPAGSKARCYGDGTIVVAGLAGYPTSHLTVEQFESDGTPDWAWAGTDALTAPIGLDTDGNGDMFVAANQGGRYAVYGLDSGGNTLWSWSSAGPSDTFRSMSVGQALTLSGSRGSDSYTVSLDTSGNVLWEADDQNAGNGYSVALDGVGLSFVCGQVGTAGSTTATGAVALYGADGSLQWATNAAPLTTVIKADVTNSVARCIGQGSGDNSIAIAAWQVN